MASENSKLLQRALAPLLKLHGFKKLGATRRKITGDTIEILNLQGSQWGPSFYINLGVYFRALGHIDGACEYDCHIRTRLSELVPDRARFNALLDFEQSALQGVRASELEAIVAEYALPWLTRISTIDGAREYCSTQPLRSPWIVKEARELLGVSHGA